MSLEFITNKDPNKLHIEINNINLSLVNAIRRVVLSDFPTIGFKTEEYLNSDLKVFTNTSSINNEYILHRLGLVPIYYPTIKSFNPSNYKFILNKENTTNSTISVKSNDFKIINIETGEEEDTIKFFPPDPITNDFILILKLKQNPNKIGEKLHVEGKASISTGSVNARFSPVSCITFSNKIDEAKKEIGLKHYLEKTLTEEELTNSKLVKSKTLDFNLSLSERFFHTDKNDNPNMFNMYIESIGVVSPQLILYDTLDIIKNKLNITKTIINNIITEQLDSEKIKIYSSRDTMDCYEILINDESHTLGNLIQSYATEIFDLNILPFIGYKNPHPLKKYIIFKIKTQNNTLEEINNIISKTCDSIIEIITSLKKEIEIKFKFKKTLKKKK